MREQRRWQHHWVLTRAWVRHHGLTTLLLSGLLVSMLVHLLTLGALVRVRHGVSRQLTDSADHLAMLRQQAI